MCPFVGRGCSSGGRERSLWLQVSKHTGTTFDMVTDFYVDVGGRVEQDVHTRSELDETHALASFQAVSYLGIKHDSPRQQARDLFKDNSLAVPFHGDDVLFVQIREALFMAFRYWPRW